VWVDPYGPILILKTVVAEVDGARTIHMKKNQVYFILLYSIFNNMKHFLWCWGCDNKCVIGTVIFVMQKILFRAFIGIFAISASVGTAIFTLPWTIHLVIKDSPNLVESDPATTSTIYASDGKIVATIRPSEKFEPIGNAQLPLQLSKVIVASEDIRFYEHHGVDPIGLLRAAYRNFRNGGVVEGGSTITQQVVKNLIVGSQRSYERKIREALFALRLEKDTTKDEILRKYLDVTYYGDGIRGAQTASKEWFGINAGELSLAQASLLAAVLPSPARYSPFDHPVAAEKRRQLVLDTVLNSGLATTKEVEDARLVVLTPKRPKSNLVSIQTDFPWLLDTAIIEIKRLAPEIDLLGGGYEIYTGIDIKLQKDMQNSISKALLRDGMPGGAASVIDATTGEIRALIGGKDYNKSQVNSALGIFGGGSGRQSGSSFKPIVLAAAIDSGWGLTDRIDAPAFLSFPGREPAYNYDKRNWGKISLQTATTWSVNTAYLNLVSDVSIKKVAQLARGLGITTTSKGPEIAIGVDEVSPLALSAAYGAFANDGIWMTPHLISKITRNQEIIYKPIIEKRQVMKSETAKEVHKALMQVVSEGTGSRAEIEKITVAGKTGTTDSYADAWFTGWNKNLVGTVWVGFLEGRLPMNGIPGWGSISGGSLPASIWKSGMARSLITEAKDLGIYDITESISAEIDDNTNLFPDEIENTNTEISKDPTGTFPSDPDEDKTNNTDLESSILDATEEIPNNSIPIPNIPSSSP